MLAKNHSLRTTSRASVYRDPINLGDGAPLAKKPVPCITMLVPREINRGCRGRKGVRESCQIAVQGRSFDLRQKKKKKKESFRLYQHGLFSS